MISVTLGNFIRFKIEGLSQSNLDFQTVRTIYQSIRFQIVKFIKIVMIDKTNKITKDMKVINIVKKFKDVKIIQNIKILRFLRLPIVKLSYWYFVECLN